MSSIRRGRGLLASGPPRSAGAGAQTIDGQSQGSAQDTATITNLTSIKSMIPDNKNEAVAARNSGLYEEASKKSADVLVEAIKSSVQISSVSVRGMRGRGLFSGNRNIVVKRESDEMQTTDKKDIVTPASSAISGTISRPRGRGLFNGSQNIGGHRESDKTQFGWILSREDVPEVGQPAPRTDIEESTKYSSPSTLRGGFGTSTRGRGKLALGVADRRSDLEKKETVPVEPPRQSMPSTRGIPKPGFGSGFGRGASSTAAINVSGLNTLQSSTGGPENLQTGKVVAENPDWEASDEGDTDADTSKAPNIASTTIPVSRGTFGRGRGRGILANRGALTGTNQSQIDSSGQVGQQIVGERPFMAQNMDSNQASRGQQVRGFGAARGRGRGVQTLGSNLGASQPTAVNRDQGSFNPNRQTAGDAPNRGRGFNRPNDFGDRNRTEGENNRRNDPSGGDPRTEREGGEPRSDPYVPLVRSVEEIIKEDVEQKAYYQTIADGDENVSASYSGFSSQHKHAVALDTWKAPA